MKRIIIKSTNNVGQKCKTYIFDYKNSFIFNKYTLIEDLSFQSMVGGETIIKKTENYILTFHRFSIKKDTLFKALSIFGFSTIKDYVLEK